MWSLEQLGHRQPPRSHPKASWVTTHSQQVSSLGGGSLPLNWGAVSVFYSPSWQGGLVICLYIAVFKITITNNSIWHQALVYQQLNGQTVLFQTSQFCISCLFVDMSNHSIWPIDRTLLGATTPGQSGPGSNGNKGVLRIPQSSSITGTSPSDCLVSYPDTHWGGLTPLQRGSQHILQPQPTGRGCLYQRIMIYLLNNEC